MTRATYAELGDACATAHAMELIGERWTYPILRELMLGPKRFSELLASVRGITPAVLTARLRTLAGSGLLQVSGSDYVLTPWAEQLGPILRDLGRWAQASPKLPSGRGGLTPDAVVQAMLTMAGADVPTRPLEVGLELFDDRLARPVSSEYRLRWDSAGLSAHRQPAHGAAMVKCDATAWGQILFDGITIDDVGAVVSGDRRVIRSFVSTFRRSLAAPR